MVKSVRRGDYILALDQGTTGSTAALFKRSDYSLIATSKVEFRQIYPRSGWVEHNPEEIWKSILTAIQRSFSLARKKNENFSPSAIAAIGITNQRETVVPLDLRRGLALGNAIVWQDRRTAQRCDAIKKSHLHHKIVKSTGLVCDPYFSASKIEWMLKNNAKVKRAQKEGVLGFATIDSFLIFKLTGNSIFATEDSNASRTMLYDLRSGSYSEELLKLFHIPKQTLPKILPSAGGFGVTQNVPGLPNGIPITGALGDQQAALFAHGGTSEGVGKITYGTGAFLLINTGNKLPKATKGILTTVAYRLKNTRAFAVEGSAFIAGAAVQFLRDNFSWIGTSSEVEKLAIVDNRDESVVFIPSLAGLGAPYWNPHARGALFGLSRGTTKSQIARAVLESIALQNVLIVERMQSGLTTKLTKLGVDGGVAKSNLVMQFQADMCNIPLVRGEHTEMTALGAALIASVGLGDAITKSRRNTSKTFVPRMKQREAEKIVRYWQKAASLVDKLS